MAEGQTEVLEESAEAAQPDPRPAHWGSKRDHAPWPQPVAAAEPEPEPEQPKRSRK